MVEFAQSEGQVSMRILVLSDIGSSEADNPFTRELIKGLVSDVRVLVVDYGKFWLDTDIRNRWDVVIVQWPEYLVRPDDESSMEAFIQKLKALRSFGKVVTVIHNLTPHYRESVFNHRLYDLVFQQSDGLIHLGQTSPTMLANEYPKTAQLPYTVIPHGNYECFGAGVGKQQAREKLGLPLEGELVLALGQIRAQEEFDLAVKAVKGCRGSSRKLLIAGRVTFGVKTNTGRVRAWFMRVFLACRLMGKAKLSRYVFFHERTIPSSEIPLYLSASDILLIPRKRGLNSGNVALGFTFGKVVVGPSLGNIGEVLRATGNPVFDPDNPDSLGLALDRAFDLIAGGLGDANRSLALSDWKWERIGGLLCNFFIKLRTGELMSAPSQDRRVSRHV